MEEVDGDDGPSFVSSFEEGAATPNKVVFSRFANLDDSAGCLW